MENLVILNSWYVFVQYYYIKQTKNEMIKKNQKVSFDINWNLAWLMIDDIIIVKSYAKNIECVYLQYPSKNIDFIQVMSQH